MRAGAAAGALAVQAAAVSGVVKKRGSRQRRSERDAEPAGQASFGAGRRRGEGASERAERRASSSSRSTARRPSCRRCPLHAERTKVVFGAGNADADLMFVGEAPGAEEDRQGLPFVGRAGSFSTSCSRRSG